MSGIVRSLAPSLSLMAFLDLVTKLGRLMGQSVDGATGDLEAQVLHLIDV